MKLLIFAGAGTSVDLGVPAMKELAEQFREHCRQWNVHPTFVENMLRSDLDVEILIEKLDRICSAIEPLKSAGKAVDLEAAETVRSEVEWFVQHACERVTSSDSQLVWAPTLRRSAEHSMTFVTTNYDRAIELAANAEGISLDHGFARFEEGEVARWVSFDANSGRPKLIKLHGSTDWYTVLETRHPVKLRHPMPLFGQATLRSATIPELGSALVLPSREKLLTRPPYPRLTQAFLNAADSCDGAVFIGTSLRDLHVRDAAEVMASTKPVLFVNPRGLEPLVPGLIGIQQTASEFLMSTLPSALLSGAPLASLTTSSRPTTDSVEVLAVTRTAINVTEDSDRRCSAIEHLDQSGVTLDETLVSQLITDDDIDVARYALGLVAASPASKRLLTSAEASRHTTDSGFAEELDLLRSIVERKT